MSLKEEWITALRSGEYHQTKVRLRHEDGYRASYCCMWVLCDIIDPGAWGYNSSWYGHGVKPPYVLLQEVFQVPEAAYEEEPASVLSTILATMNDGEDLSFGEIADWIEAW